MSISIVADAVSNLFPEIIKKKNLDVIVMNMHLTIGDKEYNCYNDELDIREFSKTYYDLMDQGKKASTALVNTFDFLTVFEREIEKGNQVICFTMAKGISGTYNSALMAANEINEKYNKKMVHVIDSMTAGLGEGLQAIHADELVKQGLSFEELIKACEEYKLNVRSDFTVGNIKYLISTGRASRLLAKFINLIHVKILLKHNDESKIAFLGTAMGRKNSIKKLAKLTLEKIDKSIDQVVYITHCNILDDALEFEKLLKDRGVKHTEIYDYDLISGAHIGPKSIAVFYVAKPGEAS